MLNGEHLGLLYLGSTCGIMSIPKQLLRARYQKTAESQPHDGKQIGDDGKMQLAILDDYAGIAAQYFKSIPNLRVQSFPDTLDAQTEDGLQQLQRRLRPFDLVICMRERTAFPAALFDQLPNLKLLLGTGMRIPVIDLQAASDHGVLVVGTQNSSVLHSGPSTLYEQPPSPAYDSTSQQVWALLLSLCGRVPRDNTMLRIDHNAWQSGFAFALGGKTIGILGLGRIGSNTARTAVQGFGMKVIAWSENLDQEKADVAARKAGLAGGTYLVVSKEDLLRRADVVSLHYVLSDRSRGMVGSKELAMLKPTAIIVNTARAPLIDEAALLETLQTGAIHGAALDVWWEEPLPADSPWRRYDGRSELVMSPHMGYVNEATMRRWYEDQAEQVKQWIAGEEVDNRLN